MALDPTTLDYAFLAQPACLISPDGLDTLTLDYAYLAQPFVANETTEDEAIEQPRIFINT